MTIQRFTPGFTQAACVLLTVAGTSTAVLGQNALGDGRILDRNLSNQSRENTQVRDIQSQIRFSQRIVEGQAGKGRAFQGDLGYRATDDFSGTLGSETLYNFKRDSASGAIATAPGIRSTDALRYQFALTGGGGARSTGTTAFASMLYVKPKGEVSTGTFADDRTSPLGPAGVTGLRSISQFQAVSAVMPTILAVVASEQGGRIAVTASPLRGIAASTAIMPEANPAGEAGGAASALPYLGTGLTGMERRAFGVSGLDAEPAKTEKSKQPGLLTEAVDLRLSTAQGTPYRQVLDSLVQAVDTRFPATPAPTPDTGSDAKPADGQPGTKPDNLKPGEEKKPSWIDSLDRVRARLRGDMLPPADRTTTPDDKPAPESRPGIPGQDEESIIDALKRIEPKIASLIGTVESASSAYAKRVAEGEAQLAGGEYFSAEGSFSMALTGKPGDVMASVGRAHAQLGAGLFLSSAGNLRTLFTEHPEIIPVRYAASLLPSAARSETQVVKLRKELGEPGSALGADGALLLAYLGYQLERPEWLREGLEKLDSLTPRDDAPGRELARLLRLVWLKPAAAEPGK